MGKITVSDNDIQGAERMKCLGPMLSSNVDAYNRTDLKFVTKNGLSIEVDRRRIKCRPKQRWHAQWHVSACQWSTSVDLHVSTCWQACSVNFRQCFIFWIALRLRLIPINLGDYFTPDWLLGIFGKIKSKAFIQFTIVYFRNNESFGYTYIIFNHSFSDSVFVL